MESWNEAWSNIRPIQKAAGLSFLLGKLSFIPAGASIFLSDRTFAIVMISIYILFIVLSIVLCFIDVYQQRNVEDSKLYKASKLLNVSEKKLKLLLENNNEM